MNAPFHKKSHGWFSLSAILVIVLAACAPAAAPANSFSAPASESTLPALSTITPRPTPIPTLPPTAVPVIVPTTVPTLLPATTPTMQATSSGDDMGYGYGDNYGSKKNTPDNTKNGTDDTLSSAAVVKVVTDPKLGQILVDGKGMTLYIYTKDSPDMSNCKGACLQAWPALLTKGKPAAGPGIDDSLLSTISLADGSQQVTYKHNPLYTYAKDTQSGSTSGQAVGGVWYVLAP